ncbi:MAG: hypothetical protein ACXWBL_15450, partial [Usitatibacter sp.]
TDYATPMYLAAVSAVIARSGAAAVDYVGTSLGGHVGVFVSGKSQGILGKSIYGWLKGHA